MISQPHRAEATSRTTTRGCPYGGTSDRRHYGKVIYESALREANRGNPQSLKSQMPDSPLGPPTGWAGNRARAWLQNCRLRKG